MIRTIVFDFGNVVAFFDHGRSVAKLAPHGPLAPVELALRIYGDPIADDYERGFLSTTEFVREALLNGKLSCTPVQFLAAYTDIFWPNPEVRDLIPRLKPQYRLLLGSNTNEAHFLHFTADYAAELAPFDHLVASHHAAARKPDPAFFAYAQQFTHAAPDECLFVDDLPVNVEAARRFGWEGLVYQPGGTLPEKLRAAGVQFT
ncbi:MAG TPA: HAD family phosphatase [Urbifossiella sp.]|jgi:putative hydrolase of the HAD superfamily|nr:HAD family phosphatase [Urbifossiella sp.]